MCTLLHRGTLLRHVVTVLLLWTSALHAACPKDPVTLTEVLPGLAVRHGLWPAQADASALHWATSVVLWHDQQASVIDPGPSRCQGLQLQSRMRALGAKRTTTLINTHAHAEQVLANSAWPSSTPVLATATTRASMQKRCPNCLAALREHLGPSAMKGTRIVWPGGILQPDQWIQAGGRHWQVLEARMAHTESDLMLWSPQDRILLAGGLLDGQQLVLAQGQVGGWLQALEHMERLQPQWLIGQHLVASPSQVSASIARQREALCELVRTSWEGLQEGLTESETLARWAPQDKRPQVQRQQRFNLLRAWREMEERWLAHLAPPSACSVQPQTSAGN